MKLLYFWSITLPCHNVMSRNLTFIGQMFTYFHAEKHLYFFESLAFSEKEEPRMAIGGKKKKLLFFKRGGQNDIKDHQWPENAKFLGWIQKNKLFASPNSVPLKIKFSVGPFIKVSVLIALSSWDAYLSLENCMDLWLNKTYLKLTNSCLNSSNTFL